MKVTIKLFITVLLCFSVLMGCNNNDKNQKETKTTSVDKKGNQNSNNDTGKKNDNNKQGNDGSPPTSGNSSKKAKDQVNLKLGDTATITSTIGNYEVTFNSVRSTLDAINGEKPYDQYIIVGLTIKNDGDSTLKAQDAVEGIELYSDPKGSGSSNYAETIGGVKAIKGDLQPGQTISGEALFDLAKADTYYLSDGRSLAEAGAHNLVIWSFKPSDIKK